MQEPWGRAGLCTDPQVGRSREGSPPHPPPRSRGLRGGGGEINVLTSWSRKAGGGGGALPSGSRPVPGSAVTPRPDVLPRENVPSHRPSIPQRPGSGPAWHLSNHLYLDGSRLKAASSRGGGRGRAPFPTLGPLKPAEAAHPASTRAPRNQPAGPAGTAGAGQTRDLLRGRGGWIGAEDLERRSPPPQQRGSGARGGAGGRRCCRRGRFVQRRRRPALRGWGRRGPFQLRESPLPPTW